MSTRTSGAAAGEVGAGTELATGTGQDDDAILAVGGDVTEGFQQLGPHLGVGRVLLGRPVERDGDDA